MDAERCGMASSPLRLRILLAGTLLMMFVGAVETMITVAITPSIVKSLGQMDQYPWMVHSFVLASILMTPFYGKLSDRFGVKRLSLFAIALFSLGSFVCGAATNFNTLLTGRVLQGAGFSGIMTLSFVIVGLYFPAERRGSVQGMINAVWTLASLLGPIVGSGINELLGWRWTFYLNLPFCLIAAATLMTLPKDKSKSGAGYSLDLPGIVLFGAAITLITYSLQEISKISRSPLVEWYLFAGIALLFLFWWRNRSQTNSFLPSSLLVTPGVRTAILLGFLAAGALYTTNNLLSLFVQGVLQLSTNTVGMILVAVSVGWLVGATLCGRPLNTYGFRIVAKTGALFLLGGIIAFSRISTTTTLTYLIVSALFIGAGVGVLINSSILAAQAIAPKPSLGTMTSICTSFRGLGGVIWLAGVTGVQLRSLQQGLQEIPGYCPVTGGQLLKASDEILAGASYSAEALALCNTETRIALAESIDHGFLILLIVGIGSLFVATLMPDSTPKQLEAKTPKE